jgi:hypothetical protein
MRMIVLSLCLVVRSHTRVHHDDTYHMPLNTIIDVFTRISGVGENLTAAVIMLALGIQSTGLMWLLFAHVWDMRSWRKRRCSFFSTSKHQEHPVSVHNNVPWRVGRKSS